MGEVVTDPTQYERFPPDRLGRGVHAANQRRMLARHTWDESYFLYSEETDYDLRVRDHGYSVLYVPTAVAQHLKGGSAENPGSGRFVLNKAKLYTRRHGRLAGALFWLALVVREASRAAQGKRTSRAALRDLLSPHRWREPRGPLWLDGVADLTRLLSRSPSLRQRRPPTILARRPQPRCYLATSRL